MVIGNEISGLHMFFLKFNKSVIFTEFQVRGNFSW